MKRFKRSFWLIILAAFALRFLPLRWHSFHPDEALYSWWASLIARWEDPFLLSPWVDKPPLYLYLLAFSFKVFGISEFSARFTGIFAGTLSVAFLRAWLKALYGEKVSAISATLFAFLPLPVLFSPTALTDPWLSMLILASMWMACYDKKPSLTAFLAGLGAGLALGTKQQGLFLAPFSLFLTSHCKRKGFPRFFWLSGFLIILVLVGWWDSLRWETRPSFWDRSFTTYGGLSLVPWQELGCRFLKWLELLSWTAGGPFPAAILTILLALSWRADPLRAKFDRILLGFVAFWFVPHWLFNFQIWDRYVLPVTPLLAALWGRGLTALNKLGWKIFAIALILSFSLLSLRPDGLPAGSNYSLYDGIEELVCYLRENAKPMTILYHRYLGWHLNFYLHNTGVEIRWYPSPEGLVRDLETQGAEEKLLAFTPFEEYEPVLQALKQADYSLEKTAEFSRSDGKTFKVYRILTRPGSWAPRLLKPSHGLYN